MVRAMPDEEDGQGAVVQRVFAEALLGRARADSSPAGNLYLEGRPPGAQLRAFELLRLRTPLIPFAYVASNRALLDLIVEPTPVTVIELGIGRGGQLRTLLMNPQTRSLVQSLHVVGVEPDSSPETGTGALEVARENVLQAGREAEIPVTFHPVPVRAEQLTPAHLEAAGMHGLILGNATLCLHHLRVANGHGRRDVLRLLRECGASAVVVVEHDSNHSTDALHRRFLHAYRHYRTAYRSLAAVLGASDTLLVWNEFFSPEVRNIITHEGSDRTERHQERSCWQEHLESSGWRCDPLCELLPQAAAPPGFTLKNDRYSTSLAYADVDLLSVIRGSLP